MKIRILFLVFLALLFQTNSVIAQKRLPVTKAKVLSAREIAAKVLPSVVLIITQDENGNPISQGSGFVFQPGLVVSNLHVFERASSAIVKNVKTGEISKAVEVVGMNAKEDICVIRINNINFSILSLGDSNSVQVGDEIYVASNPNGLEGSFTEGIVSGLRNEVGLFQLDAAISAGSSGGVLLNSKADAIGIIKSSLITGQNLNFAIPINKLKSLPLIFKHPVQLLGACAFRDRDRERLKGHVKWVEETYAFYFKNKLDNDYDDRWSMPPVSVKRVFDEDGNNVENIYYSKQGQTETSYKRVFDENRMLVSIITIRADGEKKVQNFNLNERIKNKIEFRDFSAKQSGGLPDMYSVYDSFGNEVEHILDSDNKTTYRYYDGGLLAGSIENIMRQGSIEKDFKYDFDENGNWKIRTEYLLIPPYYMRKNAEVYRRYSYF